jgi:hypothetical protein
MVRIPQAAARPASQPPVPQQLPPPFSAGVAQRAARGQRVHSATGAEAAIAFQHLLADVPRLGAQLPFVHAEFRAKRKAPRRNLQRAPAADAPPIRPPGHRFAIHPSALHHPPQAHFNVLNRSTVCQAASLVSVHHTRHRTHLESHSVKLSSASQRQLDHPPLHHSDRESCSVDTFRKTFRRTHPHPGRGPRIQPSAYAVRPARLCPS